MTVTDQMNEKARSLEEDGFGQFAAAIVAIHWNERPKAVWLSPSEFEQLRDELPLTHRFVSKKHSETGYQNIEYRKIVYIKKTWTYPQK